MIKIYYLGKILMGKPKKISSFFPAMGGFLLTLVSIVPCDFAQGAVATLVIITVGLPAIAQPLNQVPLLITQTLVDPDQLLAQGQQLYQAGRFADAAQIWQQAVQEYARTDDILSQAQALNYLASVTEDLGEWNLAKKNIQTSINLLQNQSKLEQQGVEILAQAFNIQGNIELAIGQPETALETWKIATATYNRAGNETGKLGTQINQAQAWQSLGQYRRARSLLDELFKQLQSQPDSVMKVDGLQSLGVALQTVGDLVRSKKILEQSWEISQRLGPSKDHSAILFSIGNVTRDLGQNDLALSYYQQATKLAKNNLVRLQSQLNQLSLLRAIKKWDLAIALLPQIEANLAALPSSHYAIYARVNLAENLMKLPVGLVDHQIPDIAKILGTAIAQARQIRDQRGSASALNQLGKLYEQNQQWENAQNLTQTALQIAQTTNSPAIVARAAWQLGRIFKEKGELNQAIAAYTEAVNTLQLLRNDLVAINSDVQFNFKESVEPVYRELVSLLLQPNASQAHIIQARQVIEALQLAELDNFFRDACLKTHPQKIDSIDPQAAVIYPIILSDRLEVILSLPNAPLRHYTTPLAKEQVEVVLHNLSSSFYKGYFYNKSQLFSQQVYDWLIRPAEIDLASHNIKTLVFVLDGFFRSLPMAALYDGEKYLIEKYSIALSPGLQLFPQGLDRNQLKILAVGLTKARQGFSNLPAVAEEVKQIAASIDSHVLLDENFTRAAFKTQIETNTFPVVHIATHGQFSSNPAETFLLTWDQKIAVKDFDELLLPQGKVNLNPIQLLVLSACQTAAGDQRAILGLAGLALRSGST